MREVEKRVTDLEEKVVPELSKDMEVAKNDIKDLKTKATNISTKLAENEGKSASEITSSVFEEMRERESRRCNLVIHNISEPDQAIVDSKERISVDKTKVQELCGVLSKDGEDIQSSIRFAKRLGPVVDGASPRPLLVGFDDSAISLNVLKKAPDLSEKDEPWCTVKIVNDLTKMQRKEETKLREEVTKKNSERTAEESENWEWKVVGRRGERRIVKVQLEETTEEGEPGENSSRGGGRGRGRERPRKSKRVSKLRNNQT